MTARQRIRCASCNCSRMRASAASSVPVASAAASNSTVCDSNQTGKRRIASARPAPAATASPTWATARRNGSLAAPRDSSVKATGRATPARIMLWSPWKKVSRGRCRTIDTRGCRAQARASHPSPGGTGRDAERTAVRTGALAAPSWGLSAETGDRAAEAGGAVREGCDLFMGSPLALPLA